MRALETVPLFRGLDEPAMRRLAKIVTRRGVPADHVLFRQGDSGEELMLLLTGSARVTAHAEDRSDELSLAVLCAGDVIGEMAVLDGHPRSATVTTLEACDLGVLHREDFLKLLNTHPSMGTTLLQTLAQRVRHLNQHLTDVASLDIYRRIVKAIEEMAEEHGQETAAGILVRHPFRIEDLAGVSLARAAAAERLVQMLEVEGLLVRRDDHLLIPDLPALLRRPSPMMY